MLHSKHRHIAKHILSSTSRTSTNKYNNNNIKNNTIHLNKQQQQQLYSVLSSDKTKEVTTASAPSSSSFLFSSFVSLSTLTFFSTIPKSISFNPTNTKKKNNNNKSCNHNKMTTNNINYWSNLIIYNEDTNQCLYVKNQNPTDAISGISSNFYSFPSIQITASSSSHALSSSSSTSPKTLLNHNQMIDKLPFERLNRQLFNNQLPKQNVFYLGSLLSPYYVSKVARDHTDYYLLILSSKEVALQNLLTKDDRVPKFMLEGIESSSSSSSSSLQLEWDTPNNITSRFRQYNGSNGLLITPQTLYMNQVLGLFEKDRFNLLASQEEQDSLGTKITLEYAPGIESIPMVSNTLFPFNSTNLIMSMDQGHVLLVDPGANTIGQRHFERLITTRLTNYLDMYGANLSIFITHEHTDHWESLPLIAKHFPKAKVIAHQETLDELDINGVAPELARVAVKGKPIDKTADVDKDNEINVGNKIFDIVATPGHTSNSLCLFDRQSKTLIAGDHIVGWGSSILDFRNGNMKQYLNSTQGMIDHLQPSIAMPAHGPTSYTPIQLLQTYINHRLQREQAILQAYQSGNTSLKDILAIVYKDIDPKLNDLAIGNIKLHLQKLKEDSII